MKSKSINFNWRLAVETLIIRTIITVVVTEGVKAVIREVNKN